MADPLSLYCPKAGCSANIRAANDQVKKLKCKACKTEICFKCREEWHGDLLSCEEAMSKDLREWVEQNKDNVSQCPVCKTRIEKNKGCNHMTCGVCCYEFCWACGGSASSEDRHFDAFNGCGVRMFDEKVKAGERSRQND